MLNSGGGGGGGWNTCSGLDVCVTLKCINDPLKGHRDLPPPLPPSPSSVTSCAYLLF